MREKRKNSHEIGIHLGNSGSRQGEVMPGVFQIGAVYVKDITFTATIRTVTVHKFSGVPPVRCAVQLGDPDKGKGQTGIEFEGSAVFTIDPKGKGNRATGDIEIIQNVNFHWRRTPPLHPDPKKKKLQHECRDSNKQWQFDDRVSRGAGLGPRPAKIPFVDSPGVYLEEGPLAFEYVEMHNDFRTYFCWNVGSTRIVLARIDWSCKGDARLIGAQAGDCASVQLKQENWQLVPGSAAQNASPAVIGPGASPPAPVLQPNAKQDKWYLC
jgi:hypothetical protein